MTWFLDMLGQWVVGHILKKLSKIAIDIYLRFASEEEKAEIFRKYVEKYVQKQPNENYLRLIKSLYKNSERLKAIKVASTNLLHNTFRFKSKVKRLFGDSAGYIILLRKKIGLNAIQNIDDTLVKSEIVDRKVSEGNNFGGKTFVKFGSNLTNEIIGKLEKIIDNKYRFLVLPFYLSPDISFVSNADKVSKIFHFNMVSTINSETFKKILLECELCSFGDITNVNEDMLNESSELENTWRNKNSFRNNKELYNFIKNNPNEIDKIAEDLQNNVYRWTKYEDIKEWLNSFKLLFTSLEDVKFIS